MNNEILTEFGRRLVQEVRDETIQQWKKILDGRMRGEGTDRIRQLIGDLDHDRLKAVIPEVVDSTLFHLLFWLEEETEFRISAKIGETESNHLAQESDGLAGELFSDRGWIARFSKHV